MAVGEKNWGVMRAREGTHALGSCCKAAARAIGGRLHWWLLAHLFGRYITSFGESVVVDFFFFFASDRILLGVWPASAGHEIGSSAQLHRMNDTQVLSSGLSSPMGTKPLKLTDQLLAAAQLGDAGQVRDLLSRQGLAAKVDFRDDSGRTPLILACERGSADTVRALIDAGADVNYFNATLAQTPMLAALCCHHSACVTLLLETARVRPINGITVLTPSIDPPFTASAAAGRCTFLTTACGNNDLGSIRALIAAGADVNCIVAAPLSSSKQCSPLEFALRDATDLSCARALLLEGAHLERRTHSTLLWYLQQAEVSHIARFMLHAGGFRRIVDRVRLLMEFGCDLTAVKSDGRDAIAIISAGVDPAVTTPLLETLKGLLFY